MEPTPAIAPAMAWVLETGSPSQVAKRIEIAAPVSAQKPLRGWSRVSLVPMVRTMRQPPAHRTQSDGCAGSCDYPRRNVEVFLHSAGKKNRRDDSHRLLCIIR